ncbi:cytochrome P450, partial [Artomyces pyxidatus]
MGRRETLFQEKRGAFLQVYLQTSIAATAHISGLSFLLFVWGWGFLVILGSGAHSFIFINRPSRSMATDNSVHLVGLTKHPPLNQRIAEMSAENVFGTYYYSWFTLLSLLTLGTLFMGVCAVLFVFTGSKFRQSSLWAIPGTPAVSCITEIVAGNHNQMYHPDATKFHQHLSRTYGRVARITGFLGESQLVVSDPRACNSILMKDQDRFEMTEWFLEYGAQHRNQRKRLNPVFSATHIRSMLPLFQNITQQLLESLKAQIADRPQDVDVINWMNRTSLEMIAQGGLGYTFDSLNPNKMGNEFGRAIKEFGPTMVRIATLRMLFPLVSRWPSWILRLGSMLMPTPMVHKMVWIVDTLNRYTKEVFDNKKALLEKGDDEFGQQISKGEDIISILMKTNPDASHDRFPDEEIMGQMTTLLFAATNTTSTALSRALLMLAQHPGCQEELRQELKDALETSGEEILGYDELVSLSYLDAVCRETLRMCQMDTSVPLSRPIQTAKGPLNSLFIPRGTAIVINVEGINRDPDIWGADTDEWKPSRWLSPLPNTVSEARIPGVYSNT